MPHQYHRITLAGAAPSITSYPTKDTFDRELKKHPLDGKGDFAVACEEDCMGLSSAQLVQCINYLRVGKTIKSLHTQAEGAKRLWAILTTRKDPATETESADGTPGADVNEKSSVSNEKALADASEPPVEGGVSEPGTPADDTTTQEEDMVKKAAKTSGKKGGTKSAPKPRTPKAETDQFGLRKGSKNSEAAALFARDKGATMAQVKEKVGDSKYNLLTQLAKAGHKVKKDGHTIFLTAKR